MNFSDGLLTLFVALTAIAVITQAGVLIAIYINSKRLADQFERFMKETREMMVPIKSITENLGVASGNMVEIGVTAREQFRRVETIITDAGEALHTHIDRLDQTGRELAGRVNQTAQVVQDSIVKPFREVSALAKGVSRGLEAFLFRKNRSTVDKAHQDEELFI